MLSATVHQCPRCQGHVNIEHFARTRIPAVGATEERTDEFLYCEFCERGYEQSVYKDGTVFPLEYIRKTEPVSFGKFLQRLENAQAA